MAGIEDIKNEESIDPMDNENYELFGYSRAEPNEL